MAMTRKAKTIDDYLEGVSPPQREVLQALRETLHALVPAAEECISYQLPAFRLGGAVIAGFSAETQRARPRASSPARARRGQRP